jgi:hypothetical protein
MPKKRTEKELEVVIDGVHVTGNKFYVTVDGPSFPPYTEPIFPEPPENWRDDKSTGEMMDQVVKAMNRVETDTKEAKVIGIDIELLAEAVSALQEMPRLFDAPYSMKERKKNKQVYLQFGEREVKIMLNPEDKTQYAVLSLLRVK